MTKITLISFTLILLAMISSTENSTIIQSTENPLPECPGTPNCVRTSKTVASDSATVLNNADEVLRTMNPESIEWDEDKKQIHAVFKIPVFGYLDDVFIAVRPIGDKTELFIRSSSREGTWDIWVNRIRVNKFFRKFNRLNS